MIATGMITLLMQSEVGPRLFDHFGFIHLFSLLTLYTAPAAWLAARRHDVKEHRANMIGLYVGGLLIAGACYHQVHAHHSPHWNLGFWQIRRAERPRRCRLFLCRQPAAFAAAVALDCRVLNRSPNILATA